VHVHLAPPVGPGRGQTNVYRLLHAFIRQLFLLFGDRLEAATQQRVAFTTDFGVEANIAKTSAILLTSLCPYALNLAIEQESVAAEDKAESVLDYSSSLQIDNVLSSLQHFVDLKAAMKQLSRALASSYTWEGIVAACFSSGLAKFHAWKFISFRGRLIDWRWGGVVALCRAIAPLEAPLAELWDDSLYCNGRDRQLKSQEAGDENTVSIQSVLKRSRISFCGGVLRCCVPRLG